MMMMIKKKKANSCRHINEGEMPLSGKVMLNLDNNSNNKNNRNNTDVFYTIVRS